jgi:hypothetical protein
MARHDTTAAALAALASVLNSDAHQHLYLPRERCASAADLVRACSLPGRAVAVVRRHVDLAVRLSATSCATATYTFDANADFVGRLHLLVHTPVLANQCSVPTTETGSVAGAADQGASLRCIVPADADRPGSFAGPRFAATVIKEGVPGCEVHVDFGTDGRRFREGGPPLDQNAACDLAAYYTEYAAARLVASARLVADGHEISALTSDAIAALCELLHESHTARAGTYAAPSQATGTGTSAGAGANTWSNGASRCGNAFAHLGPDAAITADLKVRSLQVQTWTVPLPFFPHGEAFPNALVRRRSVRDVEACDPKTSLRLEIQFRPLYELVCNGSATVPSNSALTTHGGQAPVRTVTFPAVEGACTSAFAHHMLGPNKGRRAKFEPAHFRVQLVVQEFLVDPDSLRDMYADARHLVSCTRVRPLDVVTVENPHDPVVRVPLQPVQGGLQTLVWFPRLRMDAYRHMWYRMRGMVDQVTGQVSCALAAHSVSVGGHTYGPHVWEKARCTDKEIYACDFGASGVWLSPPVPECQDELVCRVNANVFADNSPLDGLDATQGLGGPPAVSVLAFALERQVLQFESRTLASIF